MHELEYTNLCLISRKLIGLDLQILSKALNIQVLSYCCYLRTSLKLSQPSQNLNSGSSCKITIIAKGIAKFIKYFHS